MRSAQSRPGGVSIALYSSESGPCCPFVAVACAFRRLSIIVSNPASVIACRLFLITSGLSMAIFIVGIGIGELAMWTKIICGSRVLE